MKTVFLSDSLMPNPFWDSINPYVTGFENILLLSWRERRLTRVGIKTGWKAFWLSTLRNLSFHNVEASAKSDEMRALVKTFVKGIFQDWSSVERTHVTLPFNP
jgi:hypothetical protein